jgi:hypothetical protein
MPIVYSRREEVFSRSYFVVDSCAHRRSRSSRFPAPANAFRFDDTDDNEPIVAVEPDGSRFLEALPVSSQES